MGYSSNLKTICMLVAALLGTAGTAHAAQNAAPPAGKTLDVRHWWMGISDDAALKVYKAHLATDGIAWHDSAVDGEQGKPFAERTHNPNGSAPDALLLKSEDIRENARSGLLLPLDALAAQEHWANAVPVPIQKFARPDGHWIAVPTEIHRLNWLWLNKRIFDKLKLAPPKTFDEMVADAKLIRAAGYIPLAHGKQDWQDALLFENAVLSAGGTKFYQQALVNFDQQALRSKTMEKAFAQLDALRGMVDEHADGRGWFFASYMVIRDKAAMQVMGDWAKSEYLLRGQKAGVDFLCVPYPGTAGSFVHVTDFFGLVKKGNENRDVQLAFASTIMDKKVQEGFSLVKGSIPVRTDIALDHMDACAQASQADLKEAEKRHTLISSARQEIDNRAYGTIMKAAHQFMESSQTPQEAAERLATEFKYYKKD